MDNETPEETVKRKTVKREMVKNEKLPAISPVHMNQNLFCAIDIETTGLEFTKHEILQLAILPLNADFTPSKHFRPFEIKIKPENLDTAEEQADVVNKGLLRRAMTEGIERWTAADFLNDWFTSLKLPERKKIIPLGCNYSFDRDFILNFLGGPLSYDQYFRSDYRDVQMTALSINDMCDFHAIRIPFPKVKLSYLCSCLLVEHINKHDALGDCVATAEVYRRLMRYKDYEGSIKVEAAKHEQETEWMRKK